jgi:ABC-2 type transport system permease protein
MGTGIFVLGAPFVGVSVAHPGLLLLIGVVSSFTFSSLGTMVGALATRVDHISFLTNVVIQPLSFLGGVFYSVEMLPQTLKVATLFDPIFHMVDAARYATLRTSDLDPYPTIGIVFLMAALAFAGAWWAISKGPSVRY